MTDWDILTRLIQVESEEQLEVARFLGPALLGGISTFSRIAESMVGCDNAAGMAGMTMFDDRDAAVRSRPDLAPDM
jgi:hypothetical protein